MRTVSETDWKKDWALTEGALSRFLQWIDEGADSGGEKYLEMRLRLVSYFDRKNCLSPDELANVFAQTSHGSEGMSARRIYSASSRCQPFDKGENYEESPYLCAPP